jgi:hypothetical protein
MIHLSSSGNEESSQPKQIGGARINQTLASTIYQSGYPRGQQAASQVSQHL